MSTGPVIAVCATCRRSSRGWQQIDVLDRVLLLGLNIMIEPILFQVISVIAQRLAFAQPATLMFALEAPLEGEIPAIPAPFAQPSAAGRRGMIGKWAALDQAIGRCAGTSARLYIRPGRRSVAQPGRALLSGGRGRRFKSSHSDQLF